LVTKLSPAGPLAELPSQVPTKSTAKRATPPEEAVSAIDDAPGAVMASPELLDETETETEAVAAPVPEPAPVVVAAPPPARPANDAAPMPMSHNMGRSPSMGPGRIMPPPRAMAKAENFVEGDHVVYPTHGVGRVERIATEEIAGHKLELIHITFEENRMTLRVPVTKARTAGLRKLATRKMFDEAMTVLRGRARIKRTMWSRRAQEYEAKINSGDPLAIAEVVRDLHRNAGQPDQSFSERQIYEAAMDRLAAELGALDGIDKAAASQKLVDFLKTVVAQKPVEE
jgi:CarD family transcriptional regulator